MNRELTARGAVPAGHDHALDELRKRIRRLLLANVSEGYSRLLDARYCYVQPSPETYPFQFWWDTGTGFSQHALLWFLLGMLVAVKRLDADAAAAGVHGGDPAGAPA